MVRICVEQAYEVYEKTPTYLKNNPFMNNTASLGLYLGAFLIKLAAIIDDEKKCASVSESAQGSKLLTIGGLKPSSSMKWVGYHLYFNVERSTSLLYSNIKRR